MLRRWPRALRDARSLLTWCPGGGGPDERLTPRAAAWFLLLLSPLLFDSEALHTHL
jgi:hypothetical protein